MSLVVVVVKAFSSLPPRISTISTLFVKSRDYYLGGIVNELRLNPAER